MDEYEAKFADMQKFIPFLEAMIDRLKKVKDQSRASQLQKLQSLHGILTDNSKRKLNFDLLLRCEDVLQNLHSKVEKGNSTVSKAQSTKNTDDTKPNDSRLIEPKIECTTDNKSIEDNKMRNKIPFVKKVGHDETPASPSPPASPDQTGDSTNVKPIIIPTERSDGFTGAATDDRPASPDVCEMIASIGPRVPIIIPTERESPNPLRNVDPDPISQKIPTWTYPDSIPNRTEPITNLWQTNSASKGTSARPRVIRHIPTVPIPSKGLGCVLKKPVLVLDKGRKSPSTETVEAPGSDFDIPSISESRLQSPDSDSHLPRAVKTSPKIKDFSSLPKLSTTSLLASPPPVLTIPPLTSEDLAELLQDDNEKKDNEKPEIPKKASDSKKTSVEGAKDWTRKVDKDSDKKASPRTSPSKSKKDEKSSKNVAPTPMDVDRDTERCREEVDRPIARIHSHETGRKSFTSPSGSSVKHTESRASSSSSSASTERPTDPRNRPPSPTKDRHRASSEIRYADNYEKHPRQSRDNHKASSKSDSNPTNSAFSRNSEVASRATSEERNSALYHRRSYSGNGPSYQELDPRREKSVEFYKNILQRERERERERELEKQRERERESQRERERELQRERERDLQRERDIEREILNQSSGRGMNHHSPGRGGEICNQNQWGPNVNYPPGPQGPIMYPPQQQHPDRWMQGGPNNLPVEPHMMVEPGGHMRPQQYQGPPNSCGRPILNPQDMNMGGPCMDRNMDMNMGGPCMDRNMGPCMDMNIGPRMDPGCMDMNIGPRMDQGCMDMNMGPRMDPGCGDMNIGPCMDQGFRDDMNNMGPQPMGLQQHPNVMPGMMPAQGYPMGSQYHQFPQENRPNVQQFDRPQDFPQSRQSWDQPNNRPNDNVQYPRPQGPPGPQQGQWNRPHRGGVAGVGPQPVPPPLMTPPLAQAGPPPQPNRNFNERGRGSESSRNSSYNRDPRDSRDHRDSRDPRDPREPRDSRDLRDSRDPRTRTEGPTNVQNVNTPAPGPPSNSRREFSRFSKETSQLPAHSAKSRANSSSNDRNQRRRGNDSKDSNKHSASKEKELEREQNRKREEKKRDPKNDNKNEKESVTTKSANENLSKDVMQSPLESLYGVIDTTAKTGKGYGLQKFKIPKKKKVDPVPSPPKVVDDVIEENWDAPDENQDCVITNEKRSDITEIPRASRRKETDDKKSEVTSTTGESTHDRQAIEDSGCVTSKGTLSKSRESEKRAKKLSESEQIIDTSTNNDEHSNTASKASEKSPKVTEELIQALIRKSLESGEVKELLENKLREKFGEAFQGKKFKKILNIIESDLSGSSDAEEPTENKKTAFKKKRRVIVSDSSEDECLAERLDKIDTVEKNETRGKTSRIEETKNTKESGGKSSNTNNADENLNDNTTTNKTSESSKDGANDEQDASIKTGRSIRRQRRRESRKTKSADIAAEEAIENSEPGVESKEQQQANEKLDDPPKPQSGKPKPRRRNSLEMLQEDIREMFISEGVVTATGHRMCRLIKEAQENLTTTVESQAKKGSTTGSLDRQSARNESDFEEEIQRPHSVNSKARRGRGNGRRRQRCRTKIQKSVKEIPTSDSETEDSVRTEVSVLNEPNEVDKSVDVSAKTDDINNSKSEKEDTDGSHFLRRSERVGLRDSGRGPRNHDKSNKMESSKTMFDSSSDESFGIDVSELTAAVDISLHPESRGCITSSPVTKRPANVKSRKQKAGKAKESAGKSDKTENVASADEVESIASDLSRTSSLTRSKKTNSTSTKQDTNDELMSDLLIGLDNSKIPGNKSVDRDGDNENNTMTAQETKNGGRRRKKKKPSWALGIVRKKKKKTQSRTPTPSIETEMATATRSPVETSFDEPGKMNVETKEEILSDESLSKCTHGLADKLTKEARIIVQKSEPISPVKSVSSVNNSAMNFDDTSEGEKQLDELLMDDKVDDESDSLVQMKPKIFNNEELLKYIWLPKQDRFSCLYCPWNGKNIVHHYALSHGTQEILISRLPIEQSKVAKEEALSGNYEKRSPNTVTKDNRKFLCRFCTFQTVGAPTMAIEAFYEHCTTHTGEYRFRCRNCTYRTVARSSMRTHCSRKRNNPCRGDYANTSMAFVEDPVPDDDFLYGYICTACNFVQLKESNVVEHVKLQHATSPDTEILKIDMSSHVDDDLYCDTDEKETKPELKLEDDLQAGMEGANAETRELDAPSNALINASGTITESIDIDEESLKNEKLKEEDITDVPESTKEQLESETASALQEIPNGNLNAFVCPPEVENKEFEIQLERQKKMQEVVENIGLSSNLNEKRDLSILETLKEKMTENMSKDSEEGEIGEPETPDESGNVLTEEASSISLPILLPESVTSLAPGADSVEQVEKQSEDSIKKEPEETAGDLSIAPNDEIDSEMEGKLDKKMKDPLTNLDEGHKDDSSGDDDDSDIETIPAQPQSYDSDTSTEQSDSEIPADVKSLLEETFSINTIANAPMMTTIQRLAAKLKGEKSFVAPIGDSISEKNEDNEPQKTSDGLIPKKPNAIPISSIQRFLDRRNAMLQEVVKEVGDVGDKELNVDVPPSPPKFPVATIPTPVASPPKKFIRLRRLSGDKLSMPGPVETPAVITPLEVSRASSLDGSTSDAVGEILQTDTEEECSFLRIENVVSLAPGTENNPHEATVDDIKLTVANTTLKSSGPISLLRKSTSNILKRPIPASINITSSNLPMRPVGTIPIATLQVKATGGLPSTYIPIRPAPTPAISVPMKSSGVLSTSPASTRPALAVPITSGSSRPATSQVVPLSGVLPVSPSSTKNFKLVKVVRGLTLLKQKDSTHRIFGNNLKTSEAFNAMLQPAKLRQFYKCMSRSCTYTTDCQQSFGLHYRQHKENVDRTKGVMSTFDFQRCPYCTETLTTWNAMNEHLKDKHIYCQYQCNYCFYRGIAQSYVELHQMTVHQSLPPSVLLGQRESPPVEVIDRREFVIPFVCHHECGKSFYVPGAFLAHLRTKHGNSLSIFKCHLCPAPSFKAETLIAHYKLHGIYKYQCLYCLFGSEQAADIHAHLSASHYNRPPHVLERTLQPRPLRDKDVIQQLIVLNVDESYKCSELTLVPGQDSAEISKTKTWLQVDRNLTNDTSSAAGDVTLPIGNIGMSRHFSYEKSDTNEPVITSRPSTPPTNNIVPVIAKIRKISPMKSAESVLIVGDKSIIRKIPKQKDGIAEPLTIVTSTSSDITSASIINTAFSLPATSSNGECSDEFVNVNVLDNPEFLKDVDLQSSTKILTGPVKIKDDDSDIEILEDIKSPLKKPKLSSNVDKKPVFIAVKEEGTVAMNEETPSVVENPTEPCSFDICSSNENSLDANTGANQSTTEAEDTSDRPLTLDDIRDTGFTGSQLYRCGYDGCEYGADTSATLRTHIKECFYASETKNLNCVHCSKRFMKIGFLVEHFKLHGLKRFGCSMCKGRWPMSYQAMSHMKSKHKQTYTKLIPADPKNPSAEGLYIVEPIPTNGTCRKKKGRVKSSEKEDKSDVEKIYYGPTDIESLPRPAIYQREVHCAVCSYTTKVRTNIMRHLQLHAEDKLVPESGPVNPVPCLDKKERMFDKMVNLASSSHQNGRMSTKTTKEPTIDTDAESLPKFVPENRRYVCGVTDCNYVSLNETMLRCHLKALHSDELYFRCPHCPPPAPGHETQNVAIDKMAVHLKMHDSRLYKCSHCNNHHFHRHVVERHLSDKHPDVNPYVKVIREPENTENVQQSGNQDDAQGDEALTDDGYHWKCNLCEHKCSYKAEMLAHALSAHDEKGQFKCNTCSYKTNNKISFEQHLNAKHPYDLNAECLYNYEKMKGSMKKVATTESTEISNLEEPFDTTPLWRRDMPRVRHIRGILFEDEKPEGKSSKRKSDAEPSAKPAKIKATKSATSDASNADSDSLWSDSFASENSKADLTIDIAESFREAEPGSSTFTTVDMTKLIRKFGPLGSPIAVFYRCTICQTFKTKYKHDMRDHLYRDLKYWRYRCQLCGYMGVNKTASLKHFERNHEPRRPTDKEQTILPVDHELETWVQALLKSQSNQMRGFPTGSDGNALQDVKFRKSGLTNVRRSSVESLQSPAKDVSKKSKTSDLTTSKDDENLIVDEILIDVESNDSNDFDALAIDNKEDFDDDDLADDSSSTSESKVSVKLPITCKYCNVKLSTLRGFKLHVEIRHLRRRKFLCVYCDTSLNTEANMLKHLKVVHPGETSTIHQNPEVDPTELTTEFWDNEYKFMSRDRAKKRKRKEDGAGAIDLFEKTPGVFHICNKCGFRAINYFGLSVHMRRHATSKNHKCAYCTYAACTKSELWQHSELNHSNLDWKVGNGDLNIVDESELKEIAISSKDRPAEDYDDETASTSGTSGSFIVAKSDMMYSCFYCDSGNTTLDGVEDHWNLVHKKTPGMPFRFKEIPFDSTKSTLRCGYCPKKGTAAQIRLHSRKKHPVKPVKFVEIPLVPMAWVCQWCEDLCDTEAQKKVHHNLFHSHKLPNFKRQEINTKASPRHECPECPFKAISRPAMEKHLEKHVDSVICKRCDKTFRDVSIGILHNTQAHPGEVSKIEGFKTNVERMMARVKWRTDPNQDKNTFETVARSALENTWKNCGVARKSTTKSIIPVHPEPKSIRAVARKSTNPLPRYPPGIRFLTSEDSNESIQRERNVSYYGQPIVPVNLNNISTYMTLSGGRRMKVDCSSLAQFIDIEPSVMIKDLKHNK